MFPFFLLNHLVIAFVQLRDKKREISSQATYKAPRERDRNVWSLKVDFNLNYFHIGRKCALFSHLITDVNDMEDMNQFNNYNKRSNFQGSL